MKTTSLLAVCLLLCLCFGAISYADIQVLDPGYKAELYVSYADTSGTRDMVFDSGGNLYITQAATQSITKITSDKQVIKSWVTGLNNPCGIEFTGGTSYGNNLYVDCIDSSTVVKIDMNGNKSNFSSINAATTLEYDNTGQYGNKLYVGTSAYDRVYSVSTTGSATAFCNSFYDLGGCIQGMDFANSASFGYGMYIGTWYPNNTDKSGIFKVLTNGTAQRFCSNLVCSFAINYDEAGLFGGDLFANGRENWVDSWGLYRISSNGIASRFVNSGVGFAFGNDGALYALDVAGQTSTVYRITPIPEPATLALLGLGLLGLRRRK